ncbi:MAG TPA: methyltransferase domain-containing protein [Solirubrobacteraceae bacterium]
MSTTTTINPTPTDLTGLAELKVAHRGIWASGDYADVAERLVDAVPPAHLIQLAGIEPGMEVLDLAAGTGNVAIRAAQLGARVTALDLAPELFVRGRERAAAAGVEVDWVEGDAEALPFADGSFDRVLSSLGIQFAPRHEVAAREAVRVTRRGGLVVFLNWAPQGHIGQILKTVGSRMPKPPAFASPPPLWGDEAYVRELLEALGVEVRFETGRCPFVGFDSPERYVDYLATNYGPLLKARERLTPEGRWEELRAELAAVTASFDQGEPGALRVESEYLVTLGRVGAA